MENLDVQINSIIPDGWRLWSIDASTGAFNVMLVRDDAGVAAWHALSEEMRDVVALYASGVNYSLVSALRDASIQAYGEAEL